MATRRTDIYNTSYKENSYKNARKWLESTNLLQKEREILMRWNQTLLCKGCSKERIGKLLSQAQVLKTRFLFDFSNPEQTHLEKLIIQLREQSQWSRATLTDYFRWIRQFYRWYLDESEYEFKANTQSILKWIKRNLKTPLQKKIIREHEIIDEEELSQLIEKGCVNSFEKAFVATLHESGARIEEILNMRRNDVIIKEKYIEIILIGKTGERSILLISNAGYLRRWLIECPHKLKENYFIWSSPTSVTEMKPLKYAGAVKLLKRVHQRAQFTEKKCNPHHYRHSRLSINAVFMSDSILKTFAGWTIGSRCVENYVHIGKKQVFSVLLKQKGIVIEEKENVLRYCPNCLTQCLESNCYCGLCGIKLKSVS